MGFVFVKHVGFIIIKWFYMMTTVAFLSLAVAGQ